MQEEGYLIFSEEDIRELLTYYNELVNRGYKTSAYDLSYERQEKILNHLKNKRFGSIRKEMEQLMADSGQEKE